MGKNKKGNALNLTAFEKDALKEVGNIGAGKASSALAKLVGKTVLIDMTTVRVMSVEDISSLNGGPKNLSTGVFFEITGEIPGHFLLLSPKVATLSLLNLINGKKGASSIGYEGEDLLKEVGNILTGSYLAALSDFSGMNLVESTPVLMVNNFSTIFKEIVSRQNLEIRHVLVVDTKMHINKKMVTKQLIFILNPNSFKVLFDTLADKLRSRRKNL